MFLAARITGRRADGRPSAEALSTGALFVLLAGAFMMLRPWGPAGALDPFLEAGLRTLLLAVAGLCAALSAARPGPKNEAPASGDSPGLIGRWLGQALLLLALGHATLCQVLLFNPLWAGWRPAVAGPPLLDSLAAGLLAPAVVLAFATLARVSVRRWLLAIYAAGAAVMMLMWELLELRRLFQGPTLHGAIDAVGRTEVAAYALAALSAAWATAWLGDLADRRRLTVSPLSPQLAGVGRAGAWASLAFCLLVFGYLASPWWGPLQRPLDSAADALLLLALYSAAAAGLLLAELRSPCGQGLLGRALRMGSVAVSFALVTLLVRIGFRGLDLRPDGREAGLETWTFSAVWGLFGFALLIAGVARRVNDLRLAGLAVLMATLAKVFLFDLSRLEGVVRAGSFLAVGAVLLAAAVLARRLSGEAGGWSMRRGRRAGAAHQAD